MKALYKLVFFFNMLFFKYFIVPNPALMIVQEKIIVKGEGVSEAGGDLDDQFVGIIFLSPSLGKI